MCVHGVGYSFQICNETERGDHHTLNNRPQRVSEQ